MIESRKVRNRMVKKSGEVEDRCISGLLYTDDVCLIIAGIIAAEGLKVSGKKKDANSVQGSL